MFREGIEEDLVLESQGLVRPHKPGARFARSVAIDSGRDYLKGAVLTKVK